MSSPPTAKKVDPGWNDPPILNYTASNPPPKSRIMNKRVAFPLSSDQSSPTVGLCQTKVPPSTMPPLSVQSVTCDASVVGDIKALEEILLNVEIALKNVSDSDVVKEKLNLFQMMWKENKLNSKIQKSTLDLSKYVVQCNVEKANEIMDLQLMAEDSNLCEPWIDGFKELISNKNIEN